MPSTVLRAFLVRCSTMATVLVPRGQAAARGAEAVLVWAFLRRNDQVYIQKFQRCNFVLLQAILACILFNLLTFYECIVVHAHVLSTCA